MHLLKQSQLKSYGFTEADQTCHKTVHSSVVAFVLKLKARLEKKKPEVSKYNHEHVEQVLNMRKSQSGGRVALPIDYFGGKHTAEMTTDMASPSLNPTAEWARPELQATFRPLFVGGASQFTVSSSAFKKITEEVGIQLTSKGLAAAKQAFEQKFSQVLASVSKKYKKEPVLKNTMLSSVLAQKKFKMLAK